MTSDPAVQFKLSQVENPPFFCGRTCAEGRLPTALRQELQQRSREFIGRILLHPVRRANDRSEYRLRNLSGELFPVFRLLPGVIHSPQDHRWCRDFPMPVYQRHGLVRIERRRVAE